MKYPPELSYDAVRLAEALKKKGTVETPKSNWRALGIQVGVCFRSLPPNVYFLHGPLECVCLTVDDDKEENEVVRGLDKDFEECEVVNAGVSDTDSDYVDDVDNDGGSETDEHVDVGSEEKEVVRGKSNMKRKRMRKDGERGRIQQQARELLKNN